MDSKIRKELFQMEHDILELSTKANELSKLIEVDGSEEPDMRRLYVKSLDQCSMSLTILSFELHIVAL